MVQQYNTETYNMYSKNITSHAKTHLGVLMLRLNRAANTPCSNNKGWVVHPSNLTGLYGCNFDSLETERPCVDYEPAHAFRLQTPPSLTSVTESQAWLCTVWVT